jgi:RimJ/RimL family protein N-acetyltransferase
VAGWRGRGLAAAATRLVAAWALAELGLSAIHIDREPDNLASARLAELLGAAPVGPRPRVYGDATVELIRHTLTGPGAPC